MRPDLAVLALAAVAAVAAPVSAHGDLAVHELETLAIRDFEGQEDSFPWEGFEIWDVYVGDGYDAVRDAHGVYFKANLAGDGTKRPTGSAVWTVDVRFLVGDEAVERQIVHDGTAVTTTFEALEWTIADGNVFQVKAWTPVPAWQGKTVRDIVLVSSVDGEPRDTAPGGIHLPGTGTEVPVEAPSSGVFPPMGEGRIVEEVPLTGPEKYLELTVTPVGNGSFDVTVKNPLAQQGQHVHLREPAAGAWSLASPLPSVELDGGASATFRVALVPDTEAAVVEPLTLDFYTDIGGRHLRYAYLDQGEVRLTPDGAAATTATREPAQPSPAPGLAAVALAFVAVAVARAARPR